MSMTRRAKGLRYRSPRHRMPLSSAHESSRRASMSWRATSARPYFKRTFDAIIHVGEDGVTETIAVEPRSPRAGYGDDGEAESRALAAALEQTVCQICGGARQISLATS